MIDVLPKILIELRDDVEVDALVDGRVRGWEPAPGDAQPAGKYKAFIVLVRLDAPVMVRAPLQTATILARCYGTDKANAYAVYAAASEAIHHIGARLHANGLGIYLSLDDTGASQDEDPITKQPLETFVVRALATTQAVTA